jgi:hypothetical protein
MNLIEIFKCCKKGQKIKRKGWVNCWITNKNQGFPCDLRIENNQFSIPTFSDILADDWEIVKEKKKVVIENMEFDYETVENRSRLIPRHPCYATFKENTKKIPINKQIKMTLEWEE